MYAAYTVLLGLGLVLAFPYYLWRGRLDGRYARSFRERLGRLPAGIAAERPSIWIHAVSVGEVLVARSLVAPLRERFPEHRVFVSTTTVTGQELARETLEGAAGLFYAPFDFPGPVRRALAALRPALVVLVDTELWPNLIRETRRSGARLALVNGRISERSYPRYRRLRPLLGRVLAEVDVFLMQSELYARRLRDAGAPPDRVRVVGSLKFDAAAAQPPSPELRALLAAPDPGHELWVAGSTMPGEEPAVLEAHARIRREHPGCRLLIAPRHPARAGEVASLLEAAGLACLRRSAMRAGDWRRDEQVVVLDTLGELAGVYSLASVVYVGGSLVPTGGHNILEATVAGRPVVVGPHMENFEAIADLFRRERAMLEVRSGAELGAAVAGLLAEPERREALGERGRQLTLSQRGVLERTVASLGELLS